MRDTTAMRKGRAGRALVCAFLAAAVASSLSSIPCRDAFAATISEKQAEANEIAANIDTLQTELNAATAEFERAQAARDAAEAKADEARILAAAANKRVQEVQALLSERAVSMYKSGTDFTSYLSVLLGAASFDDFATSLSAIEKITQHDADMIRESKEARAQAESAEDEYTAQKVAAAQEMDSAAAAQERIETAKRLLEEQLAHTNEEIAMLIAKEEEERIAEEEARARAAAAAAATAQMSPETAAVLSGWVHPCPSYYGVTNGFGWAGAWDGVYHNGIDLGAQMGDPIVSAGAGTVTYVGWYGSGGNAVIVSHGDGVRTIYMHMSEQATAVGAQVQPGDVIGYVGSTGYSTGPHLHFQIEVGGTPIDPLTYFRF